MVPTLLLKVLQSAEDKYPLADALDVAWLHVQVPDDDAIEIPDAPLVANAPANEIVRSADRSPPPVRANPALIVREVPTLLLNIVQSAAVRRPRAFEVADGK
ncbi:MAG: hypothetical protein FJW69_07435 [Actinobacteria bacterium]|nr:hypothetical protein [Actinomycetota bacterium]